MNNCIILLLSVLNFRLDSRSAFDLNRTKIYSQSQPQRILKPNTSGIDSAEKLRKEEEEKKASPAQTPGLPLPPASIASRGKLAWGEEAARFHLVYCRQLKRRCVCLINAPPPTAPVAGGSFTRAMPPMAEEIRRGGGGRRFFGSIVWFFGGAMRAGPWIKTRIYYFGIEKFSGSWGIRTKNRLSGGWGCLQVYVNVARFLLGY